MRLIVALGMLIVGGFLIVKGTDIMWMYITGSVLLVLAPLIVLDYEKWNLGKVYVCAIVALFAVFMAINGWIRFN
jgi:hypothetical protein